MSVAPRRAGWFERVCAGGAFVVPFAVALAHASSASVWRDDLAMLRGLAWVGNGMAGGVSALLTQISFFFPLGSLAFRASALAALALGASSWVVFRLARTVLARLVEAPRLGSALAAIAGWMATLTATAQREGTVAGGASIALLLSLLVADAIASGEVSEARAWAIGSIGGALVAENAAVAIAMGLAIASSWYFARPAPRVWATLAVGAAATAAFVWAPLYVRPLAAAPFLDLGRSAAALGPATAEAAARPFGAIGALRDEVGAIASLLAAAGAAIGLARRRVRAQTLSLVVVVAIDAVASLRPGALVSPEQLAALHLVALSFLCVGVAIAVQTLAVTLLDMQLVMAKQTTILLVMGDLAIATASAEEAAFSADRSSARGAEAFTDEAVERLVPRAALIVRSRPAAQRVWAARLVDGTRPDLLLAPAPILGDTRLALGVLRAEPAFQPSLRDISLEGRPGEAALTTLADARPVLVELDAGWDRKIVSHLVADHGWLRFAPEPLGASDRKAAFVDLRARIERVLAAATVDERVDAATASVLHARLVDAAAVAAMLGDRDEATSLVEQLGKISSDDRFASELAQRLTATKSGAVDVRGLLR